MTVDEIIAKVNEALQDDSIMPTLQDVNSAVAFIASQSYLPFLVAAGPVTFDSISETVTGATNTAPIVLTIADTAQLATGDIVVVTGVEGNTSANSEFYIQVLSPTTLELLNSYGNGDYIAGGTITRHDSYVDLPADFDHDLFEAFSLSQNLKLNIRSNFKAVSEIHTTYSRLNNDNIESVAVENGLLYGLPIGKQKDVVMCKYYRKPTAMIATTETPSCIPEHLHDPIIVHYILSLKWPLIEDGLDGASANTDRAIAMVGGGMAALAAYYPRPSMSWPKIERHTQFF